MLNKDNLHLRIKILADSSIISDDIAKFGMRIVDSLDNNYSDDMCSMFITHLVMALNRVKNNEPVECLDSSVFEEIKQNSHFSDALKNYDKLMIDSPYELPEQEKEFLLMHLTNLLENQ